MDFRISIFIFHTFNILCHFTEGTLSLFERNIPNKGNDTYDITDGNVITNISNEPSFSSCAFKCHFGSCGAFVYDYKTNDCFTMSTLLPGYVLGQVTNVYVKHNRCHSLPTWLPSGSYILLLPSGPKSVTCDMSTLGGGWTVMQNRFNGEQDFYRTWIEYKNGFGNSDSEYWIGNDALYDLTSASTYELVIIMQDINGIVRVARYDSFAIGPEEDNFRLSVSGFTGNLTDSLLEYHNGLEFTTKDSDNDIHVTLNCAQFYLGAWWYGNCYRSNLNGPYKLAQGSDTESMSWRNFYPGTNDFTPLRASKMMIRQV